MSAPVTQVARATVKLENKRGLHARASHKFVECAETFLAVVTVTSHNNVCAESVIADSVMELLLLGSACGENITIEAAGEDADKAVQALTQLVLTKFGEPE